MPIILVNLVLMSVLISVAVRVLGLEGVICCLRVYMKEIFNMLKCCRGSTLDILTDQRMEDDSRWMPHSECFISFEGTVGRTGQLVGRQCEHTEGTPALACFSLQAQWG